MVCPNCGCECDENQMFCTKCGTKVNAFENDITPTPIDKTEDDILGGITIESGKEETGKIIGESSNLKHSSEIYDSLDDEEFDEDYVPGKRNYQSTSKKKVSNKKNNYNRKTLSKKNVLLLIILTLVLMAIAVFSTLAVKKSTMTKKFDAYYGQGQKYYDDKEYEYAKTQFINASNNAFTKEQKIKSYEMIYTVDGILGGYEQEQIKYLELLIDIDDSNIDYYKDLIILYQNNDMDSMIEPLIASAPKDFRDELAKFDGTIPTASVEEGTYDKPIEITLSASDDVKIFYTIDGSNPKDSTSKKQYLEPIKLVTEGAVTLRAYSEDSNGKTSKDMSVQYVLNFKKVKAPTVEPKSGEYESEEEIVVTAENDCKIYYTTDGTIPTEKSKQYKKPIKMPKENSVFYFIAIDDEGVTSSVVTRAYNYAPRKISYDQALESLKESLINNGKLENANMEFKNGDVAYLSYQSTETISDSEYYIVNFEIIDKNGGGVSSKTYAVSCEDGSVSSVTKDGSSYSFGSTAEEE